MIIQNLTETSATYHFKPRGVILGPAGSPNNLDTQLVRDTDENGKLADALALKGMIRIVEDFRKPVDPPEKPPQGGTSGDGLKGSDPQADQGDTDENAAPPENKTSNAPSAKKEKSKSSKKQNK